MEQFNIKVSMVEPVWFKTKLGKTSVPIGAAAGSCESF
ncbi:hypothetical protein LC55x_5443 [Lysobacter capsici]|nr:hypothetical protein LC55x_5443 [Lysobacter capsici]